MWKKKKWLRILIYSILIIGLPIAAVITIGMAISTLSSQILFIKLALGVPSVLLFFLTILGTVFCIYKCIRELRLLYVGIVLLFFYLFLVTANSINRPRYYQTETSLPIHVLYSAKIVGAELILPFRSLPPILWNAVKDLNYAWKGTGYQRYISFEPSSEPGTDVISECINITFQKPYTIGQRGTVQIYEEYNNNYSSIVLYKEPDTTKGHTGEYKVGDNLIIKEGPIPSKYDTDFFWKVGYENDNTKDGWCVDYFGPSPQG